MKLIFFLSLILFSICEEVNDTQKEKPDPFKLSAKEEEALKYDESMGKNQSNWEDSPEYKEQMRLEGEKYLKSNITFHLEEMGLGNVTSINLEQFKLLFKKIFGVGEKKE